MTDRKSINVVAAIIERDGAVLATQRGYGDFAGWWEFPGGKIEPGETPEAALEREIAEELHAAVRVVRHVKSVSFDYPAFHLDMSCWLCRLEGQGAFQLVEHEDARWLRAADLDSVRWLPADADVIAAIKKQGIV